MARPRACLGCSSVSSRGKEGPAGSEFANRWYCENCWKSWEGDSVQESKKPVLAKGDQDPCAREGCPFKKHSKLAIKFCCRACADSGEHGPACERRPCKTGGHGATAAPPLSRPAQPVPAAAAAAPAAARAAPAAAAGARGRQDPAQTSSMLEPVHLPVDEYSVAASQVFIRAAPSLNSEKVGTLPQGALVTGRASGGWLCLDGGARARAQLREGQAGFVLIDGSQYNLGKLLEHRNTRPPCGAFSKDVYTDALQYTALRPLTVWERPSEDSKKLGILDAGKPAVGYPMGDWFELKDRWGWVMILREGKEVLRPGDQAFRALVQRKFVEGLLFTWTPIPARNVSYDIEWAVPSDVNSEWDDVGEDEVTRELGVRNVGAHVRSLAPSTRVLFRVFAHVLVESSEADKDSPLVGTWEYGSKPTRYRVIKLDGGRLKFDGPHSQSGRVSGALEPVGPYLQAEACDPQGERVGTIRLRLREEDGSLVSNWKNISQDEWGKDIVARKGPTEKVLTTLSSNWVEEYTGFPISEKEEKDCRYDALSNLRGGCQRCSCQGFVTLAMEVSSLEQCLCRRCGCPCTRHALIEEYLAKERPSNSGLKITTRTWSVEDLKPSDDAVSYVIAQIEAAENLYETLGVPHTATAQELRRAFRSISLRLHPDKLVGRAAAEPELAAKAEIFFKLLSAANEVLSNEKQRRDYDIQWKGELQKLQKNDMKEQKVQAQREKREQMMRKFREMDSEMQRDPSGGLGGELGEGLFRGGGMFGRSGMYTEHGGGGFTWQFPGGGSITVDHTQNFANRAHMSEKMPWEWMAQGRELYAKQGQASGPPGSLSSGLQSSAAQASPFTAPYRRHEQ